jgi:glycosyltransferase involved in cell wall biosynthesis
MVSSLTEKPTSRDLEERGRSVRMAAPGMKILILATDIFSRGGIAKYTWTLASTLGGLLGAENVDVLCFFDWGYQGQSPHDFGVKGMVSSRPRASVWAQLRFLFEVAKAGMRGYDLVIVNHVALAPVAAMIKLVFGTPCWVSCHSVEIWWGTSRLRYAALRHADLILPVSRYTANVVQKMKGIQSSQVKVVYNTVPDSFSELLIPQGVPRLPGAGPMLLSVCSLVNGNEFKGVDTVIRALPRLLKAVPDLRYVVVGDGELRPMLQALAAEVRVAENVKFMGEVSDAELAEQYRTCDVFVLPSRGQQEHGVTGGEGFGRVYVEAALAGKPVVGSRSGGAAEAILHGKTGFGVDPDSVEDVAESILTLLRHPQLAAEMGSAGRAWGLATFSQDALSASLRDLLRPYGFANEGARILAHAGERL